jgi:integrase
MTKPASKTVCMNPGCGEQFAPGHYGKYQLVCTGGTTVACPKCHGSGKRGGAMCEKCHGKKKVVQSCQEWYRHYYQQTRKPPRGIPDDILDRLIAAAKDPCWRSYLVVASRSGMRKGEMLGLTWGDVLDKKTVRPTISVRGQWDGQIGAFRETKTRQSRTAYLLEDARQALAAYAATVTPNPAERVWNASESGVWRWFKALQKRLKVANPDTGRNYRVHDLRHSAALRTYRATKDITRAQVLLGHRSPATTQIYAQERPEVFLKTLEDSFKEPRS